MHLSQEHPDGQACNGLSVKINKLHILSIWMPINVAKANSNSQDVFRPKEKSRWWLIES